MKLPKLVEIPTSKSVIEEFRGLNYGMKIGSGEFADMTNMTSDFYPVLATSPKRGVKQTTGNDDVTSIAVKGELIYLKLVSQESPNEDYLSVYINDVVVNDFRLSNAEDTKPKQFVSFGPYICIFPDKKYVNTKDFYDCGSMSKTFSTGEAVTITLCDADGNSISIGSCSDTEPSNPNNGDTWYDTKSGNIKKYYAEESSWSIVTTNYVKIIVSGIYPLNGFRGDDGIRISGLSDEDPNITALNKSAIIKKIQSGSANSSIVIPGMITPTSAGTVVKTCSGGITIRRNVPDMDYVVEANNRLWGCRYHTETPAGSDVAVTINEIYASKLGDIRNWEVYENVSTDSYAASVGTDGPFTGAVNYGGYPIFFKENFIHKVYGYYPANFQIQTVKCNGVQIGSARSISDVNGVLFYNSLHGFCAYDGSTPVIVSSAIENKKYKNAIACSYNGKYHVVCEEDQGGKVLLVYDVSKGLWHKEEASNVIDIAASNDQIYMLEEYEEDDKTKHRIITEYGREKIETETRSGVQHIELIKTDKQKWSVTTGKIGLSSTGSKYIVKILVRMQLGEGASVRFSAKYDSQNQWAPICYINHPNCRSFTLPIKPRRCDHLQLHISGVGECRIYSIAYIIEQGSDYNDR